MSKSMQKSRIEDEYHKCLQCKNNDQELQRAIKDTQRVKRENDQLRDNLKGMSKVLDETLLEKAKFKQAKKPDIEQDNRIEVLEKQIKNTEKQVKNYKESLEYFKKKSQGDYSIEKVNELQIQLREKTDKLKDLKSQNKRLDVEKRRTEKKLLIDKPEKPLNSAREEIMHLRNKLRDFKRKKEQNESNYEAQEKYIEELIQKQKDICDQVGIEYKQIQKPTLEKLFVKKEEEYNYSDSDDEEKKQKQVKITYETFSKMEQHIRILNESMAQNEKKHQYEVNLLEKEIQKVEDEKNEFKESLEFKQKYLEETSEKLKQIQGQMKRSSYTEMGMLIKKEQSIRRTLAGVQISSEKARSFKDVQELVHPDDMYISEITITSYRNYITGLEVLYRSRKGMEKQLVTCFKTMGTIQDAISQTLKFSAIEYITSITGYCSLHIEYIKIITSRGYYIYAGDDKAYLHCNKFSIDINKEERPTSFFGTVDKPSNSKRSRKQDDNEEAEKLVENEFVLVAIGLELRKRESLQQKMDNMKISMLQRSEIPEDQELESNMGEQDGVSNNHSHLEQDNDTRINNENKSELKSEHSEGMKNSSKAYSKPSEQIDDDNNDKVVL